MEARDSASSSRASSQNCMAEKLVFPLNLGRVVSDPASSSTLGPMSDAVSGTFAFYVKCRRATQPTDKLTLQNAAQLGQSRLPSPVKARNPRADGSTMSTPLSIRQGSQHRDDPLNFRVLLVEDNLVNRKRTPHSVHVFMLTVNKRKYLANSYERPDVQCTLRTMVKKHWTFWNGLICGTSILMAKLLMSSLWTWRCRLWGDFSVPDESGSCRVRVS